MDLKSYPNLDPKLKETYDRIMGTGTSVKPSHHAAKTPQTNASHSTQSTPHDATSHGSHTDKVSSTPHHLTHLAYNAADGNLKAHEKGANTPHAEKKSEVNKNNLIVPIVLGVCGVLFFVFYSYFWMNFFGM
jgi:hypothetical protein